MVVRVCAVGVALAVSALLLRELGWRATPVFAAVSTLAIISLVLPEISELVGDTMLTLSHLGVSDVARAVLKIVGIGYLVGICSDVCRELGAERVGSAITFVGRVEILAVAMPHVFKMLKLGLELIE